MLAKMIGFATRFHLCHDPLIPHQSNWAGEALVYQWLRKRVVRKNLF
jgi:hypothetical protein